jgi:hypothetical protein
MVGVRAAGPRARVRWRLGEAFGRMVGAATNRRRAESGLIRLRSIDRNRLFGMIGHSLHGALLLVVAVAAVLYFGTVFLVLSFIIAAMGVVSLNDAWSSFLDSTGR